MRNSNNTDPSTEETNTIAGPMVPTLIAYALDIVDRISAKSELTPSVQEARVALAILESNRGYHMWRDHNVTVAVVKVRDYLTEASPTYRRLLACQPKLPGQRSERHRAGGVS
jgi:hypothetical protein